MRLHAFHNVWQPERFIFPGCSLILYFNNYHFLLTCVLNVCVTILVPFSLVTVIDFFPTIEFYSVGKHLPLLLWVGNVDAIRIYYNYNDRIKREKYATLKIKKDTKSNKKM